MTDYSTLTDSLLPEVVCSMVVSLVRSILVLSNAKRAGEIDKGRERPR